MNIGKILLGFSLVFLFNACDDDAGSGGYYFEYSYEEEVYEEEAAPAPRPETPPPAQEYIPEDIEDSEVTDVQDKEFKPDAVSDLVSNVLTDGKLDTNKVVANIINNLKYISKQPVGIAFACEYYGYFTTNLLLPMKKNEEFVSMYLPRKFGQKKYHFVVMNFKGNIGCKQYAVDCKRSTMGYEELFVFWPENDKQRTQCGMIIAIADEYLKDIETRLNINYRIGEEDANYTSYGNIEYLLKKSIPGDS